MEKWSVLHDRLLKLRAQRWSREALLAALLTIAAVVFIAAAMVTSDTSSQDKTAVETSQTPKR